MPNLVPFPGQQFLELTLRGVGDASEHFGEPGLRIDVVECCGHDQRGHDSGTVSAALGAREQPRLSSEGEAAQGALGGIVGEADPAVINEAGKPILAAQHIINRLGDSG
jgi:hypothetical protein